MRLDFERTIVALASPLAPGQRAIVRLSGSKTKALLQSILRDSDTPSQHRSRKSATTLSEFIESKVAVFRHAVVDLDWHNRLLPVGVYYWPTSRSFTGQPSAELHFLGALPLAQKVIERITQLGAHPAERGEFTLRSFLSGKIDLVQVEAVLGVIESIVGQQLEWALSQLGGNLSQPVRELRGELLNLLSDLEAGLDFVEEDIEFITNEQLRDQLIEMDHKLDFLTSSLISRGARVRPLEIVLVGLPNAGKSTLFNAILGEERSITSDQSGTTRDAVAGNLSFEEYGPLQITLVDTAGIEQLAEDSPRSLAQDALQNRLSVADLVVLCIDLSNLPASGWLQEQLAHLSKGGRTVVCVGTKSDLHVPMSHLNSRFPIDQLDQLVSVRHSDSVDGLRAALYRQCELQVNQRFTEATHHTAVRFRHAIAHAQENLHQALGLLESGQGHELVACELHQALETLGAIIGEVHNDDILGQIFSRFCIGK